MDPEKAKHLAEAERYDRLADEATRELAAKPPEYYREMAAAHRRAAGE